MNFHQKKYGGGINALNESKLPKDLKLLFSNVYLDYAKILMILSYFSRRRKGVLLDEVTYYYTLLDFVNIEEDVSFIEEHYLQNTYIKNELEIKNAIIKLVSGNYLEIEIEKQLNKSCLFLKLTKVGLDLIDSLTNKYFDIWRKKMKVLMSEYKYSANKKQEMMNKNE